LNLKTLQIFIFDLDGVIYLGNELIPGAKEVLKILTNQKKQIFFLTNNATQTRAKFSEKLRKLGIPARSDQIITSAYITAEVLRKSYPNTNVYIIGEEGLITEFQGAGFQIVEAEDLENPIDLVVVGLDRNVTYKKLARASSAILRGAKFIATNTDPCLPTEEGLLPGAGCMVAALSTAVGSDPEIIIGKPNPFMIEYILEQQQMPPALAVIIGDRYSTDILAGKKADIKTILVKTGTGLRELQKIPSSGPKPDLILDSIADLLNYLK